MLTEGQGVNSPRSIVTDHYLLDQYGKVGRKAHAVGPANNSISKCTTSVHILPLAFPCTLAMIRKVAMGVPPARAGSSDQGARMVI